MVLISSLFKLFIMMLVKELFGKEMNVCMWGVVLSEGESAFIFLLPFDSKFFSMYKWNI